MKVVDAAPSSQNIKRDKLNANNVNGVNKKSKRDLVQSKRVIKSDEPTILAGAADDFANKFNKKVQKPSKMQIADCDDHATMKASKDDLKHKNKITRNESKVKTSSKSFKKHTISRSVQQSTVDASKTAADAHVASVNSSETIFDTANPPIAVCCCVIVW